jgi:hypothetical protein
MQEGRPAVALQNRRMLFSYSCQWMFQGKSLHMLAGLWVAQECKFLLQSLCAAANASTPIASLNWLPCLHASSIMLLPCVAFIPKNLLFLLLLLRLLHSACRPAGSW